MGQLLYNYYKDKFDIIGVDTKANGFSSFNSIKDINTKIDFVIDFSSNKAFYDLVYALENNIPVISGTTGYDAKEIKLLYEIGKGKFYHSNNFSKGIKLFKKLVKQINNPDIEFDLIEIHSDKKKDCPSGTAKMLADELECDYSKIQALRLKNANPVHKIVFIDKYEKIELIHEITSPNAFVEGFDEFLKEIIT